MLNDIRKWFWTKVAEWKYRKQEYNVVCCCGNDIKHIPEYVPNPDGFSLVVDKTKKGNLRCTDFYCISRCAKEYAVTSYVESKLKSSKGKMKDV